MDFSERVSATSNNLRMNTLCQESSSLFHQKQPASSAPSTSLLSMMVNPANLMMSVKEPSSAATAQEAEDNFPSSTTSPVCVSEPPSSEFSPVGDLGVFYEQATWRMYERIQAARHEIQYPQQFHHQGAPPSYTNWDAAARNAAPQEEDLEQEDDLEDEGVFEMDL